MLITHNRKKSTMKRIILSVLAAAIALTMFGSGTPAVAAGPSSYDQTWTQAMNQTSYWAPWQCTKYDGHGGWIPAKYDAAIIKAGQKVRVYPDLENVGGFQASAPDGKDISWVMKCTKPTPPTTTPPTTVPPTTVPPTTQPPVTTVPPTTEPPVTTQPPTTVPPTDPPSTTEPPTTEPPSTTPPTSVTSVPPTAPPPPSVPPTITELPDTGAETWIVALLGALALTGGIGLTRLARRS